MRFFSLTLRWSILSLVLAPIGCSFAPIFQPSDPQLAPIFRNVDQKDGVASETIANLPWWVVFKDPDLQNILKTSLANNKDLQLTAARIAEARAQLGFVRADQFPLVNISGNIQRTDPGSAFAFASVINNYGLSADLSFELDVWGKLRNATEAQRQALYSSEYTYRSVTLSLVAAVAEAYFKLVDADNRILIAKNTYSTRHEATEIIRAKFDKGVVSELDLNQAQIEEGDAMVSIAAFERQRGLIENALYTLIGGSTQPIRRASSQTFQTLQIDLPIGVPVGLIERRPDIMAARADVESQYSLIGVAQADRLPSLSILGSFGLASSESSEFFDAKSKSWLIGGGLLGPLIDWGKYESQAEAQIARAEQAVKSYEKTILVAAQEVEDALVSNRTFKGEYEGTQFKLKAATSAARLSRARYDEGVSPYLEVLDSERSLFEAQLDSSRTVQEYLSTIVQLYKALGGGWEISETDPNALTAALGK